MRALAFTFLAVLFTKLMVIGLGNFAAQFILPGALLVLVLLMIAASKKGRTGLSDYIFLTPLLIVLLVFLFGVLSAALNGLPLTASVTSLLRFMTMLSVAVGAYLVVFAGLGKLGQQLLYASFFIHILAAILLYFVGVGYEIGGVLRPTGLTGRPQLIANIASLAIVFYLCQMLSDRKWRRAETLSVVLLGLVFVALSGTLKNFVSVLFISALALLSIRTRYRIPLAIFGAGILTLSIYYAVQELPIGDRLVEAIDAGLTTDVAIGDQLESSLMWRMLHWRLLLEDWLENYFWLGAGLGQVSNLNALKTDSGAGFIAHSDWIGFLVEFGPFLFVLFGIAQISIYRRIVRGDRIGYEGFYALRFCYLLLALMAVGGNVFYSAAHMYQFWWLAGLIAGQAVLRGHADVQVS